MITNNHLISVLISANFFLPKTPANFFLPIND